MIYPSLTEFQIEAACRRMLTYGDNFAKTIAAALLHADGANRPRLLTAFDELFRRYSVWP